MRIRFKRLLNAFKRFRPTEYRVSSEAMHAGIHADETVSIRSIATLRVSNV